MPKELKSLAVSQFNLNSLKQPCFTLLIADFSMGRLGQAEEIAQRQIYRQAAAFGQSAYDLGAKANPAISEVTALTTEILTNFKTLAAK